jgi:hypothetical protein
MIANDEQTNKRVKNNILRSLYITLGVWMTFLSINRNINATISYISQALVVIFIPVFTLVEQMNPSIGPTRSGELSISNVVDNNVASKVDQEAKGVFGTTVRARTI